MNPALAFLDVFTRPRVVLGLRVIWDFFVGVLLVAGISGVQGIVNFRSDLLVVGLATLGAGAWGFVSVLRPLKKVST